MGCDRASYRERLRRLQGFGGRSSVYGWSLSLGMALPRNSVIPAKAGIEIIKATRTSRTSTTTRMMLYSVLMTQYCISSPPLLTWREVCFHHFPVQLNSQSGLVG